MGRGSSKAGGSKGGAGGTNAQNTNPTISTPSGVTYDQFMQMSMDERYDVVDRILTDGSINVPSYLDPSDTTKIIYALGMNNKMNVVSDSQLEQMQGREIYRTVYDSPNPRITSDVILDQIRTGDYTQLSNSGGSAHGRALYFSDNFSASASYGEFERNAMVMRAKINQNANFITKDSLRSQMKSDATFMKRFGSVVFTNISNRHDSISIYALTHGYDGWTHQVGSNKDYVMVLNRGVLTASNLNKRISNVNTSNPTVNNVTSWNAAANVN